MSGSGGDAKLFTRVRSTVEALCIGTSLKLSALRTQGKVEALKVELQQLDGRKDKGYVKTKVCESWTRYRYEYSVPVLRSESPCSKPSRRSCEFWWRRHRQEPSPFARPLISPIYRWTAQI